MKISVVIPTHNREQLLKIAVESAVNQSYKPFEVIVIDDVPSMRTEAYVNSMTSNSDCGKMIYLTNLEGGAQIRSRNIASKRAKGDYLAFLDDDDYWDKNYLQRVAESITKKVVDIVVTKITAFNQHEEFWDYKTPPSNFELNEFLLTNPGVVCSNFVVKKDRFFQVGGYDESVIGSSDKDLFMQLVMRGSSYHVLKERLVFYRKGHDDQKCRDNRQTLKNVLPFYRKYFKEMNILSHFKMLKKICRLSVLSVYRPIEA